MGYESRANDQAYSMRLQAASVGSALFGGTPEQKKQFMEQGAVPKALEAADLAKDARRELWDIRGRGLRFVSPGVNFVEIQNGVDDLVQGARFGHLKFESDVRSAVDEWESLTAVLGKSLDESSGGKVADVPTAVMRIEDGNKMLDKVESASTELGTSCGQMSDHADELVKKLSNLNEFFDSVDDLRDRAVRNREQVSDRLSNAEVVDLATRARIAGEKLLLAREDLGLSRDGFRDAANRCGAVGGYAHDRALGREMADVCAEADAMNAAREARHEAWDKALAALRNGLSAYGSDGPSGGDAPEAPEDVPEKEPKDGPGKDTDNPSF